MDALLKTRAKLTERTRQKMRVILQIEELDWLVEREAGNMVRRWRKGMAGEGNRSETYGRTLQHI